MHVLFLQEPTEGYEHVCSVDVCVCVCVCCSLTVKDPRGSGLAFLGASAARQAD